MYSWGNEPRKIKNIYMELELTTVGNKAYIWILGFTEKHLMMFSCPLITIENYWNHDPRKTSL